MNRNDQDPEEVRSYVRDRMAGDLPPEFIGDVMNDVHRTPQRRRGSGGWPILAGLGTVVAAAALVIIVLPLLDGDGVGEGPSPTASASVSAEASPTSVPSEAQSQGESASASVEATEEPIGEFGPILSMTPEEAFGAARSCENPGAITSVGDQTDDRYGISMPEDWHFNTAFDNWAECTLFGPEPIDSTSDGTTPAGAMIVINLPPGGDFMTDGSSVETEEYTVDGVAAVRYTIQPGGFVTAPTVVWIVAINGQLPAEGNAMPYLAVSTSAADVDEFERNVDVLDRMIATLDILE